MVADKVIEDLKIKFKDNSLMLKLIDEYFKKKYSNFSSILNKNVEELIDETIKHSI